MKIPFKNNITFLLIFLTGNIYGSQCSQDNRTFSEYLLSSEAKTIFVCRLNELIPDKVEVNKPIETNDGMMRLRVSDPQFQDHIYIAEVLKTFFGKIDTTHILIHSYSRYNIGDTFLIYTKSNRQYYSFYDKYCVQRTKLYRDATEFELNTLSKISNLITNKKTRKCEIKNGDVILSKGKIKKGKLVKTWIHNYENGVLKTKIENKINKTTTYYSNGFIQGSNQVYKDSVVSYNYSSKVEGQLEYLITWYDNYQTELSRDYKNGKLKNLHYATSMIGYVKNWIDYYDNGNIYIKGQYLNGKKTGEWITYNDNGSIQKVESFDEKK